MKDNKIKTSENIKENNNKKFSQQDNSLNNNF